MNPNIDSTCLKVTSFRTVLQLLLVFPQYSYSLLPSFSPFHPKSIHLSNQQHVVVQQQKTEKQITNSIPASFVKSNAILSATMDPSSIDTIDTEEGFPSDPASTTPQLLSALWDLISQGCKLPKGVS